MGLLQYSLPLGHMKTLLNLWGTQAISAPAWKQGLILISTLKMKLVGRDYHIDLQGLQSQ